MASLSREYRRQLERVIIEARQVGEKGAINALKSLAVDHHEPLGGMTKTQRDLRNRLRAHGRQLGDQLDKQRGTQGIRHLATECAYEHWHRMLFARFLAENNLLIEPESRVALSLDDCRELAREKNSDWVELASSFAVKMLPQIFRVGDPVLEVALPPETHGQLEELLESLPTEVFAADDSLGWVYQFWQSELKDQVNASGEKIGADELPAVTQLFTEDYMVLFLLHNTLGAWWMAKRKAEGKDPNLPGYEWTYLRLKDDGSPAAGAFEGWPILARDIKVLDPSMGSGHFLVFALPILVGFRMEEEDMSREQAVESVLRDNLFGLEIDNRCTQIAAFNLALTAWHKVGGARELPQLNLACSGLGINAKEEVWLTLAGNDERARETMRRLYHLFQEAPVLGSLTNPRRVGGTLFTTEFESVRPLLEQALATEHADVAECELAVTAQGILHAARILGSEWTLVVTNVPYLGRVKQGDDLAEYCESHHPKAKSDLATCFVERCLSYCVADGTAALVTPQNWLFLTTYRALRQALLSEVEWDLVAKIGEHGFQSAQAAGAFTAMLVMSKKAPAALHEVNGVDCSKEPTPEEKARALCSSELETELQADLLTVPDARIVFGAKKSAELLQNVAFAHKGLTTNDDPQFLRLFWELQIVENGWEFHQSTVDETVLYGGREHIILFEAGRGRLRELNSEQDRDRRRDLQGANAWGRPGVAISLMRELHPTLYSGEKFDTNVSAIVPNNPDLIPAIWSFCTSSEFHEEVRRIDHKVNVTNATLVKIPFDIGRWISVAETDYPHGLPDPHSNNPTQWLFAGDPNGCERSLHAATARLVGYRWPRQTGSSFMGCTAVGPDGLEKHADHDGIVCLNPVKGVAAAADRLRALFADAWGKDWSASKQSELLSRVGYAGKTLEDWLREGSFEQHFELFHQRPFVWHIWDGLKDGFGALVNYHKLAAPNGEGKRTLEKLIYTYLGDWIDRQRADQKNGVEGSDAKLAAGEHLQKELEKILKGEPPYDIFVRWKPLHEQPVGWEPDINDGVRINIRPFMTAKVLNGRGKSTCILRSTPKIKWDKDRGKEPHRPKEEFPWFWSWDGSTEDFAGGREFDGNRWNDLHYSIQKKHEASERHKGKKKKEQRHANEYGKVGGTDRQAE